MIFLTGLLAVVLLALTTHRDAATLTLRPLSSQHRLIPRGIAFLLLALQLTLQIRNSDSTAFALIEWTGLFSVEALFAAVICTVLRRWREPLSYKQRKFGSLS